MTTIRKWLPRPCSCTNLSITSVMAAYKKMVNTRLNVHGVWMLMENCLIDPEHSEIKNIVMFSTSKVLDYSCKKKIRLYWMAIYNVHSSTIVLIFSRFYFLWIFIIIFLLLFLMSFIHTMRIRMISHFCKNETLL